MLNIFVCEQDDDQRYLLVKQIELTLKKLQLTGKVILAVGDPTELLAYLSRNVGGPHLYFMEIEFEHAMNGITLANEIRRYDKRGMIAFVTRRIEVMYLLFDYHVEAMAFILKTDQKVLEGKIEKCIKVARDRLSLNEAVELVFKNGRQSIVEQVERIIFFRKDENNPHKVIMHTQEGQQAFYGSLTEIEKMDTDFFRCHRETVVNLKNIKEVQPSGMIIMNNGVSFLGSKRKLKALMDALS
ncbi:MAG: LytTR family DNA-binding domain-containing protein [Defluviitaleaceae bacterium]|nr:LytTR family DNA-binding domain-containing protein [Defluviitaleaceae bacterium]